MDRLHQAAGSTDAIELHGTLWDPAAGLIELAIQNGANLLEVNPQETPYSRKANHEYLHFHGLAGQPRAQFVFSGSTR